MARYWEVTIHLEDRIVIEADTAPEAEQQVRDNIRDYLEPSATVVMVDAERIDACTLLDTR